VVKQVAEKWGIPPPDLEYGLEHLGWSLWFEQWCEMTQYENEELEWQRRKAQRR
jgi:hypothetical protein